MQIEKAEKQQMSEEEQEKTARQAGVTNTDQPGESSIQYADPPEDGS